MGKRLRQQRRGKGTKAYSKRPGTFDISVNYPYNTKASKEGEVTRLFNHTGHTAPLMEIEYDDFTNGNMIAPEGIKVHDKVYIGKETFTLGSVCRIGDIPEGMPVYNIESTPGDGGKLVRSAGSTAYITAHLSGATNVTLPSRASVVLNDDCRAQLGAVAGGGMTDQPLVKAGKSHYIMHATNRMWPKIRGVKSNPVDHPFGGKQHHKGKSSMTSRNAPPGRKVGHIAASRTGRRKKG
ncbi:MAG: 50S ribosomal protein L2 [Candidatus Marsarchaeota archaeon]|jgi:large subunit ribosomal protein L2|nr:50S ribosomal protein L2 [Candidatus Marsarchaeota archaeon]MCL5111708.1 50S ribosomal protein L2 [Candidatus Marsarchaeota archaeon]